MSGDGGVRDPYRMRSLVWPNTTSSARPPSYGRWRSVCGGEERTATSEGCCVHQYVASRLRRIGEITTSISETANWLTVEIAVKLVKLRAAREASSE